MCADLPPDKGATTHPAVLDAVISAAKDFGAHVIVGDGTAVGVIGKPFKVTGIEEVCRKHAVELIDFNRQPGKNVSLKDAFAFKEVSIANTYFEIDTLVNLPVFKSSIIFWLTGALKNIKGLLTGKEKHRAHRLGVPECVADLNRVVKQDLIIMDGFIGMMGDGPIAGLPANARLKEAKTINIEREACVWCLCCAEVCTNFAMQLEGIPDLLKSQQRVTAALEKAG